MGADVTAVPTHHNSPATSAPVLGHSSLAHGMERECGRDERPKTAAPRAASKSAT